MLYARPEWTRPPLIWQIASWDRKEGKWVRSCLWTAHRPSYWSRLLSLTGSRRLDAFCYRKLQGGWLETLHHCQVLWKHVVSALLVHWELPCRTIVPGLTPALLVELHHPFHGGRWTTVPLCKVSSWRPLRGLFGMSAHFREIGKKRLVAAESSPFSKNIVICLPDSSNP